MSFEGCEERELSIGGLAHEEAKMGQVGMAKNDSEESREHLPAFERRERGDAGFLGHDGGILSASLGQRSPDVQKATSWFVSGNGQDGQP